MAGAVHNSRMLRRQRNGMLYTGLGEIVFGAFWVVGGRFIPEVGPYWTVVGYGLMGLGVIFLFVAFGYSRRLSNASALMSTGLPGTAKVLYCEPTGVTVNGVPSTRVGFEVQVEGRPPYRVEEVKHSGMLMPGQSVGVMVSPDNPEELIVTPSY